MQPVNGTENSCSKLLLGSKLLPAAAAGEEFRDLFQGGFVHSSNWLCSRNVVKS